MNALGLSSRLSVMPAMLPVGPPAEGPGVGGTSASAQTVEPSVRLDIRRDDSIDRIVFEYRKISNGELVQRFPARQVVEFYQRIEAIADRAAERAPSPSGDGVPGQSSDAAAAASAPSATQTGVGSATDRQSSADFGAAAMPNPAAGGIRLQISA